MTVRRAGRPPQADPEATRARIIQVATERFALLGYSDTPVSVLAADAGLTPGTLYYHFPSKAALYEAVAAQARAELLERFLTPLLERVAGEPALATRLRLLVAALVERAADDLMLHRLCFAADLEANGVPEVGAFRDAVRDDLGELYVAVAGTAEDEELLAVVESITLGVWHFAMRPQGLERLPIVVRAVDAWLDDTLFDERGPASPGPS